MIRFYDKPEVAVFGLRQPGDLGGAGVVIFTGGDTRALTLDGWARRMLLVDLRPPIAGYLENRHFADASMLAPADPIHAELVRRIEIAREARRAAALGPGNDDQFDSWNRARDRMRKLTRALLGHLLRQQAGEGILTATDPSGALQKIAVACQVTAVTLRHAGVEADSAADAVRQFTDAAEPVAPLL